MLRNNGKLNRSGFNHAVNGNNVVESLNVSET